MLLGVSISTSLVNALVSNNACMVLMFPVCVKVSDGQRRHGRQRSREKEETHAVLDCAVLQAHQLVPSVSLKQFACVMMMAGSTDFLTPIGYQTNMMVRPMANYKFTDYTKFGAILQIGATLIAVGMTLILIK